ncbi:MAG: protein kinase [Blastocatellia bacterium]|nr:protein kinase [Blastocatellia bacterium]
MLAPNTVLQNRYLIVRLLAEGGMGAVYLARDERLGNLVALKETFFNTDHLRRAFEREARLLAGLRHPAMPRVSDHFSEGAGQFLVMEFIPGEDLAEMLHRRGSAFPPEQALEWADQLLDVLDYLHSQQPPVIHRDIKPQNLKLTERGQIILLDFGLAKGFSLHGTEATTGRSIFGYTPDYAPLEQIQREGTSTRSDLYSLAATLYHLMTGVTPPGAIARASALGGGQPDPLRPADQINPQIKPAIASVLAWAMSLNSDQRPATASVMRQALRDAARSSTAISGGPYQSPKAAPTVVASASTNISPPPAPTAPPSVPSNWPAQERAMPPTPYAQPPRKSKAVWWSLGVLVALMVFGGLGAAIAYYALNREPENVSSTSKSGSISTSNGASDSSDRSDSGKNANESKSDGPDDYAVDPGADSGEATVDRILNRYVEALGGREAFESVTSRVVKGTFELTNLGMTGTIESYAKAPNKLLVITSVPGLGATRYGYNGEVGWSSDQQLGLRALTGAELAGVIRDADFYRDANLKRTYSALTLGGKERIKGREAYRLEGTTSEGGNDRLYFDAQTGLLIRSDIERAGPQGLLSIETYFENYRTVDGLRLPFTMRQSSAIFRILIKVREVRHNVSISDSRFDMR